MGVIICFRGGGVSGGGQTHGGAIPEGLVSSVVAKAYNLENRLVLLINVMVASRINLFVIVLYILLPYNKTDVR